MRLSREIFVEELRRQKDCERIRARLVEQMGRFSGEGRVAGGDRVTAKRKLLAKLSFARRHKLIYVMDEAETTLYLSLLTRWQRIFWHLQMGGWEVARTMYGR